MTQGMLETCSSSKICRWDKCCCMQISINLNVRHNAPADIDEMFVRFSQCRIVMSPSVWMLSKQILELGRGAAYDP